MKVDLGSAYSWLEIDQAPETSGVYAWYSRLQISRADVEAVVADIQSHKTSGDEQRAKMAVERALDRFVFNPYRETPYRVELRGALKPRYGGEVNHEPSRSSSLVDRVVEQPDRFKSIAEILAGVAPGFTAPLYIGMAANLRVRLRKHKRRIIELRDTGGSPSTDDIVDAGFANQIAARGFEPTNLFVMIVEVPVDTSEHNDIENILNRINFPIFGRN
ncbi:hypothetical protein GHT07_18985 [Caenimonas koreensis DSM 17982]|uniref:Uncharacterized protein n=1 Tax=Caenimonas koreensis DSM 17982 TaxID=1121255 RepID=A0A844BCS4_9BURK|nr:hypothetical protein [Caenimonas koreensis]MRD49366.1 hypothetical protein [Caenimonas koreensis DSM 17982]